MNDAFPDKPVAPLPMTTLVTTDLTGITRGRTCPSDELEHYRLAGCGWVPAYSALTPQGVMAADNPWGDAGDLRLVPDMPSRVTLNNGPDPRAPALDFIHGDLCEIDGREWAACPRTLLRHELQRYRDELGLQVQAAFEHEFNLMDGDGPPQRAFSLQAQRQAAEFASWLLSALRTAGVEPELFDAKHGNRQFEITCRPALGVAAADRAVNVREISREIARQLGLDLSFSPKPAEHAEPNGTHLHISLQDLNGQPIFYDDSSDNRLSPLAQHWAAGILQHLPALCALTAPTPVSYDRLHARRWTATHGGVGRHDRNAALRICSTVTLAGPPIAAQFNLEFRVLDATASPHLAMAALLIAGRLGIEQRLPLNAQHNEIPATLSDALDCLRRCDALVEALPTPLLDTYFALKTEELDMTRPLSIVERCEHYAHLY